MSMLSNKALLRRHAKDLAAYEANSLLRGEAHDAIYGDILAPPVAPGPSGPISSELKKTPQALSSMLRNVGQGKANDLLGKFTQAAQAPTSSSL